MPLTLRPATGTEYEARAPRAVAGYAAQSAASGELSPEAAMAKARQPGGATQPHQAFVHPSREAGLTAWLKRSCGQVPLPFT